MHRPEIDELVNSPAYRLVMELDLKDLVAYLQRHAHDHTPIMYWYKRLVLALILIWGTGLVTVLLIDATVALHHIPGLLLRTLAILLLIIVPIHEAIHILTLVYTGARDIRFRASLRQLYFAVTVHQFVASAREVAWMAVMPFLTINMALVLLAIFTTVDKVVLLGMLALHTFLCAGDIINISIYWQYRDRERYDYVDAELNKSFTYERIHRAHM